MSNSQKTTISQSKEINLGIHLDAEHIPVALSWDATDSPIKGAKDCKAFVLRTWDSQNLQTTHIDLWTNEMSIEEMNHFLFQTLATLSDTYQRATGNKQSADELREFAFDFARKNKVTRPK